MRSTGWFDVPMPRNVQGWKAEAECSQLDDGKVIIERVRVVWADDRVEPTTTATMATRAISTKKIRAIAEYLLA